MFLIPLRPSSGSTQLPSISLPHQRSHRYIVEHGRHVQADNDYYICEEAVSNRPIIIVEIELPLRCTVLGELDEDEVQGLQCGESELEGEGHFDQREVGGQNGGS